MYVCLYSEERRSIPEAAVCKGTLDIAKEMQKMIAEDYKCEVKIYELKEVVG